MISHSTLIFPTFGERPDLTKLRWNALLQGNKSGSYSILFTLYQDGKPLNPDAFSIVSQPN